MSNVNNQLSFIPKEETPSEGYVLNIDGAARNNPGPAGAGIVLKQNETKLLEKGYFIGNKTNNQAEYLALIIGLITWKTLNKKDPPTILSDSELLIKQINGNYRVKNPDLQQLFHVAYLLTKGLKVQFKHIVRTENKDADRLANRGIDTKKALPETYRKVLDEYRIKI